MRMGEETCSVRKSLQLHDAPRGPGHTDVRGSSFVPAPQLRGEHGEDGDAQRAVVCDGSGQIPRQRQHPLAIRCLRRKDAVDEVGGLLAHPSAGAAGAQAALAPVRHHPGGPAFGAFEARKAAREVATRHHGAVLVSDERRHLPARLDRHALEERLEILGEDTAQVGVERVTRFVRANRCRVRWGSGGHDPRRQRIACRTSPKEDERWAGRQNGPRRDHRRVSPPVPKRACRPKMGLLWHSIESESGLGGHPPTGAWPARRSPRCSVAGSRRWRPYRSSLVCVRRMRALPRSSMRAV